MSDFIGMDGVSTTVTILDQMDDTMYAPWYKDRVNRIDIQELDQLYPRGRLTGVDSDGAECWLEGVWWEPPSWPAYLTGEFGTHVEYVFKGVTRDINGSPLASVTVLLFRTSDNLFITSTVSDAFGNYQIYSPYSPDTHFLVTYLAGSPDVTGATVNTLVGA